jgi:hypothetical protein
VRSGDLLAPGAWTCHALRSERHEPHTQPTRDVVWAATDVDHPRVSRTGVCAGVTGAGGVAAAPAVATVRGRGCSVRDPRCCGKRSQRQRRVDGCSRTACCSCSEIRWVSRTAGQSRALRSIAHTLSPPSLIATPRPRNGALEDPTTETDHTDTLSSPAPRGAVGGAGRRMLHCAVTDGPPAVAPAQSVRPRPCPGP